MLNRLLGLIIAKLFSPLSSFLLIVLIARMWGKENLGQYRTVLVWLAIFQFISLFGIGEYISKEVGKDTSRAAKYLLHGLFFGLISSVICIGLMVGGALFINYSMEVKYSIVTASIALPFIAATMICQAVFTSFQKIKYITIASLLESALILLMGTAIIFKYFGLITLIRYLVIIRIISAILNLYIVHKHIVKVRFQFDRDFFRKLLAPVAVFGITGVAFQIFMRIDIVILSRMKNMAEVGLYSSASKLWEICLMLPLAFYILNLPVAAQGYQGPKESAQKKIESYTSTLFVLIFFVFGFMVFFAESVLQLLYGPSFSGATSLLRIFMLAFLIQSAEMVLGMICQAAGYHKAAMNIALIRAGINIVLNIVLISVIGVLGAALATLFSILMSFAIFQIFVKRTLHEFQWITITVKPALICVGTMCLLFLLANFLNTTVLWFLFVLVYALMTFAVNGFSSLKVNTAAPG